MEEVIRGFVTGPKLEHADDPWHVEWHSILGRSPAALPVEVA